MIRRIAALGVTASVFLALSGSTDDVTNVLDNIISVEDTGKGKVNKWHIDSVPDYDLATRYTRLTDQDIHVVAKQLDIDVAIIKAVIEIEAGKDMKGFFAPGVPVINFSKPMFTRYKTRVTSKDGAKGESVPSGLSGHALREWTQLVNARKSNIQAANMATFWGMFQIGGFNYKKCGCETMDEFVRRMSFSELEQLELFAAFISNTGMAADLKKKNWAAFARKYNGSSYAKRGYHTRMAAAYKRYMAQK